MGFELFCATMIALLFGLIVTFGGYKIFMFLLPVWGFVFGFGLGAQTLQLLFGVGFLATVTGWVAGLVVGVLFAALSYAIYLFGVAMLAGSLGYIAGVSFMAWIGFEAEFLTWIVGVVVATALVIVTLVFNLQKYVVVIGTAILGSALMVGTMMMGVGGVAFTRFIDNPISSMLEGSPIWAIVFVVLVVLGAIAQLRVGPSLETTYPDSLEF